MGVMANFGIIIARQHIGDEGTKVRCDLFTVTYDTGTDDNPRSIDSLQSRESLRMERINIADMENCCCRLLPRSDDVQKISRESICRALA